MPALTEYVPDAPGEMGDRVFVVDQSRCIGCQACVQACEECGTHRGHSMMQLDFIDRGATVQTVPLICMHCADPTCAEVCPADAIKQNEDGIVQSSLKPRCIACWNCVNACPFGIPKKMFELDQMMKCDMCYDRSSVGLAPMCASVCPSQALWFGTPQEFDATRTGVLEDTMVFGGQYVRTKVQVVVHEPGPVAVAPGRRYTHWTDDPFGLDEGPAEADVSRDWPLAPALSAAQQRQAGPGAWPVAHGAGAGAGGGSAAGDAGDSRTEGARP